MKRIVVVALRHPEHDNLFLHLLRADNGKWTCPGGHMIDGETPKEAARRELFEETGIDLDQMEEMRNGEYPDEFDPKKVHLFSGVMPAAAQLSSKNDPDKEGINFKFLDPIDHKDLHIPANRNILIQHLRDSIKKSDARRKEIKRQVKQFDQDVHDVLAGQVTAVPGVSDRGIEARRADPKVTGVTSHGYSRVTSQEKHHARAKQYFKDILEAQRKQPKPNLPKSELIGFEDLDKAEAPPKFAGQAHPTNPNLIAREHGSGRVAWHLAPKLAQKYDQELARDLPKFLSKIPQSHRKIVEDTIHSVMRDPNRHFRIGWDKHPDDQVLRNRHVALLTTGKPGVTLDMSVPGQVKLTAQRHDRPNSWTTWILSPGGDHTKGIDHHGYDNLRRSSEEEFYSRTNKSVDSIDGRQGSVSDVSRRIHLASSFVRSAGLLQSSAGVQRTVKTSWNRVLAKAKQAKEVQYSVHFNGHEPLKHLSRSRSWAQWHFTKPQLKSILDNWDSVARWEPKSKMAARSGDFHPTAITRTKVTSPIREFLDKTPDTTHGKSILYHGVGRDEISRQALERSGKHKVVGYDPFHSDEKVRRLPSDQFDEVHSHYTLNVVHPEVGRKIIQEIHDRLKDNGKAVISVRRDLEANPIAKLRQRAAIAKAELKKGVMRRRAPFNPAKDPSASEHAQIREWQDYSPNISSYDEQLQQEIPSAPELMHEEREKISQMHPHAMARAIHKLSRLTQSRINPKTNEREFLLHRGMSQDEMGETLKSGIINHGHKSSWTAHKPKAEDFAQEYGGKAVSAWVPQSKIAHMPMMYGQQTQVFKHPLFNPFRDELEVIVHPEHRSEVHSVGASKEASSIHSKISSRKPGQLLQERKQKTYPPIQLELPKPTKQDKPSKPFKPKTSKLAASSLNPNSAIKSEDLDKALNDWKKQGYKLNYAPAQEKKGPYGLHTITAHDASGKQVGHLAAEDTGDGNFTAHMVEVEPAHQRKGLATAMYQLMERKTGLKAAPDLEAQTKPGEALWRQKKRPFGKSEKIPGGLASGKKPKDFDQEQLAAGIKVEMEHTTDKDIAQEIAMDHLSEDPDYYKKLKTIEKVKKAEAPNKGLALHPHVNEAIKHFGITKDPREAGYIMPGGEMLDFSGRHYSKDHPSLAGQRAVDHRELPESIIDETGGGSEGMRHFISATGAIRHSPESNGIEVSSMPTMSQLSTISYHYAKHPEGINVDITDPKTHDVVSSVNIARPGLSALKAHFERHFGGTGKSKGLQKAELGKEDPAVSLARNWAARSVDEKKDESVSKWRSGLHQKMLMPTYSEKRKKILEALAKDVPTKLVDGIRQYLLHRDDIKDYKESPLSYSAGKSVTGKSCWVPEPHISYSYKHSKAASLDDSENPRWIQRDEVIAGPELKGQSLGKSDYYGRGLPMGWISPTGEFHEMHDDDDHRDVICDLAGVHHPKSEDDESHLLDAYGKGWISVGHAGEFNIQGDSVHLKRRSSPAMHTARKLAQNVMDEYPDETHLTVHDVNLNRPGPAMFMVPSDHFVRHGTILPKHAAEHKVITVKDPSKT